MQHVTVRDKNSTAYAIIHLSDKEHVSPMVEYFRSNRVKRPERVLTRKPDQLIADRFKSLAEHKNRVSERRKERNVPHDYKEGDVLCCSWGYSMTIVDFYRVTKVIGKQTVQLESLSKTSVDGNGWHGHLLPDLNSAGTPAGRFRVSSGDSVKIGHSQYAHKWDGNAKYYNTMD